MNVYWRWETHFTTMFRVQQRSLRDDKQDTGICGLTVLANDGTKSAEYCRDVVMRTRLFRPAPILCDEDGDAPRGCHS